MKVDIPTLLLVTMVLLQVALGWPQFSQSTLLSCPFVIVFSVGTA